MNMLSGKRILLVEDEFIVAAMTEGMLTDLGAVVVGPVTTLSQALSLANSAAIDAAVLDVNLQGQRVDPVLDVLTGRGIPFVLATGYGAAAVPTGAGLFLEKPYTEQKLGQVLAQVLARRAASAG